jgi:hypothetical protein
MRLKQQQIQVFNLKKLLFQHGLTNQLRLVFMVTHGVHIQTLPFFPNDITMMHSNVNVTKKLQNNQKTVINKFIIN